MEMKEIVRYGDPTSIHTRIVYMQEIKRIESVLC